MKAQSLATLVALAASLQGVVATGWHNFPPFDCPGKNPPHHCVPDQHGGFDWKDLLPGPFDHFGGFDFSGFTCKKSFGFGKRGDIVERTFGDSKCITGIAHSDKSKCPKIRGNKVDKFSITHIKVSVEFDCDLEFHYTLPDNSICKQKSHCKKSGTVVKNDQCGGAKDVTIVYPKPPRGGKPHCNIGIHHIDFDCPPTTSSAVQSTTTSPPETTPTTETGPDTTAPPDTTQTTETGPDTTAPPDTTETTETGPDTTAPPDTTETTETGPDTTAPPDTTQTTETGPDTTAPPDTTETTETGPDTTSPPDNTQTTETGPDTTAPPDVTETTETGPDTTAPPDNTEGPSTVITTVITDVTVTTCPVTKTHVTSGITSIETSLTTSTILITTTKTICHRCTGKPQPPQTTGGSSPGGGLPCPDILPQCIKTWLPVECKSNSDTACFCPKKDFTDKLFECLAAHGATDDEIDDAAEYFQGLCAPYVPTNPGIVTACPPKGTGGSKPHTVPVTTITVHTTVTVPCEPTGTETATSFTLTTISTEVTVPQVTLSSTTGGVVIVTGPATVGATATPAPVFTTVPIVPGVASGTGSRPTATSPPFNSGASRGYVGAGLLGAVMAVAALFV